MTTRQTSKHGGTLLRSVLLRVFPGSRRVQHGPTGKGALVVRLGVAIAVAAASLVAAPLARPARAEETKSLAFSTSATQIWECSPEAPAEACPRPSASADVATGVAEIGAAVDKPATTPSSVALQQGARARFSLVDSLDVPARSIEYTIRVRVDSATVSSLAVAGSGHSEASLRATALCDSTGWSCRAWDSRTLSSSLGGEEVELSLVITDYWTLLYGPVDVTLSVDGYVAAADTFGDVQLSGCWPSLWPHYPWCEPYDMSFDIVDNPNYAASAIASSSITVLSVEARYDRTALAPPSFSADGRESAVDLSWDEPVSPLPIRGYRLYRDAVLIADETVLGAGTVSFRDTGVAPHRSYEYRVAAVNDDGEGALAYTPATTYAPPPAATLSGANGVCTNTIDQAAVASGAPAASLSWTWAADATWRTGHYRIERATTPGQFEPVGSVGTYPSLVDYPTRRWSDCNVRGDTTYYYRLVPVVSVWTDGFHDVEGEPSNVVAVTIPPTPVYDAVAPHPPAATASPVDSWTVRVSWAPAASEGVEIGPDYYNIYADGRGLVARVPGTSTSWDDRSLLPATTRTYYVTAVNVIDESERSDPATATTPAAAPDAPLNPFASADTTTRKADIRIEWSPPNSNGMPITEYRVYRVSSAGDSLLASVSPTACVAGRCYHTDTRLSWGSLYSYRISAVNEAGEGLKTAVVSATP